MSYHPNSLYTIRPGARSRHPNIVLQASRFVAREWLFGSESFSDWISDFYNTNKEAIPYVFATKLEKTARATIKLEEDLSSAVQDGYDPLDADPFVAYNDYVETFADITSYIRRLLPEERRDPFVVTLTRALERRTQIALEVAETRVQGGFARRVEQMRSGSNANHGVDELER
ncbi:hypothetical protein B0J17DRAFT_714446 [Rhizoctonia solani]|nr:hypothetical protein B0J17DRAFT_714446 [Rhizoctonia solani]